MTLSDSSSITQLSNARSTISPSSKNDTQTSVALAVQEGIRLSMSFAMLLLQNHYYTANLPSGRD
jgi:hypothetical protein